MNMGWPQAIVLFLWGFSFGAHLIKHGEPMNAKYHAGWKLFAILIMGSLLYWGGFFG